MRVRSSYYRPQKNTAKKLQKVAEAGEAKLPGSSPSLTRAVTSERPVSGRVYAATVMSGDFWESAARRDPLWAILSDPSKRGRRWELQGFFETGRREISLLLYQLKQLEHVPRPGRALDFGCGVGRLSQALASTFAEVVGVDVSPTMIELADRLNRYPRNVRYVLNQSPVLRVFAPETFDFVYSDIVLQHVEPEAAREYIREFMRVLAPGGVLVFQLPSHRRTPDEQPRQPVHMPSEAYQALVTAVEVPTSLSAGQTALTTVEVQNASTIDWNQSVYGTIRLGNHWRDAHGTLIIQDDGRTQLPLETSPGSVLRLAVPIQAPPESGSFVCEFDLVHEGITWFADRGSSTARVAVRVEAEVDEMTARPGRWPGTGSRAIGARLPRHLLDASVREIPRSRRAFRCTACTVTTCFAWSGWAGACHSLLKTKNGAGPEWRSFRYFVSKPTA